MDARILKTFQCIVTFVEDLADMFQSKQHSLMLYNRLLSKTKITHQDSIKRHVKIFHEFITKNNEAILNKDSSKLKETAILYSNKVNIKLDEIFRLADTETSNVIWKHLLVIMNTVDPSVEATNILKKTLEEKSNEGAFLSSLVNKIESSGIDPNTSDPMSAMMGMMTSGVFTDIISSMSNGMKDGSLDIGKLFGTVQSMMASLGDLSQESVSQNQSLIERKSATDEKEVVIKED